MCVYSKFTFRDTTEVDFLIYSMGPSDIIMGDVNDDIWATAPTRPWQEGLDAANLIDLLLATPNHTDSKQCYTRISRHVKPL